MFRPLVIMISVIAESLPVIAKILLFEIHGGPILSILGTFYLIVFSYHFFFFLNHDI